MLNGNLESVAIPNGLRAPDVQLHDKEHLDPHNRFLPSQKLGYSLEMAEAVSVLHSYPGGVMVHDDIQLSQVSVFAVTCVLLGTGQHVASCMVTAPVNAVLAV